MSKQGIIGRTTEIVRGIATERESRILALAAALIWAPVAAVCLVAFLSLLSRWVPVSTVPGLDSLGVPLAVLLVGVSLLLAPVGIIVLLVWLCGWQARREAASQWKAERSQFL